MTTYAALATGGPLFDIQAAIEARLRLAFPANRFQHETLPAAVTPAMWSDLARRTPMIALGFTGLKPAGMSGRLLQLRAEWRVVPVIRNGAGPRARLLGDRHGPGQLGVMQVAVAALHGMTIPGAGQVEVTDAANLYAEGYADEQSALSGISLSVLTTIAAQWGGTVDDFRTLAVNWAFDGAAGDAAAQLVTLSEDA